MERLDFEKQQRIVEMRSLISMSKTSLVLAFFLACFNVMNVREAEAQSGRWYDLSCPNENFRNALNIEITHMRGRYVYKIDGRTIYFNSGVIRDLPWYVLDMEVARACREATGESLLMERISCQAIQDLKYAGRWDPAFEERLFYFYLENESRMSKLVTQSTMRAILDC